jgi:hypothetical protein
MSTAAPKLPPNVTMFPGVTVTQALPRTSPLDDSAKFGRRAHDHQIRAAVSEALSLANDNALTRAALDDIGHRYGGYTGRAVRNWLHAHRAAVNPARPCNEAEHDQFLGCAGCGYIRDADGIFRWPANRPFEITAAMWPLIAGRTQKDALDQLFEHLPGDGISDATFCRAYNRMPAHQKAAGNGDVHAIDSADLGVPLPYERLRINEQWSIDFWHLRHELVLADGTPCSRPQAAFVIDNADEMIVAFGVYADEPSVADAVALIAEGIEGYTAPIDAGAHVFVGGLPYRVFTDGGSQFSVGLTEALAHLGVQHDIRPPKLARSAGMHERKHPVARGEALADLPGDTRAHNDRFDRPYDADIPQRATLDLARDIIGRWVYSENCHIERDKLGGRTSFEARAAAIAAHGEPRRADPVGVAYLARPYERLQTCADGVFKVHGRQYTSEVVLPAGTGGCALATYDHDPTRIEVFSADRRHHLGTAICTETVSDRVRHEIRLRHNRRDRNKAARRADALRIRWIRYGHDLVTPKPAITAAPAVAASAPAPKRPGAASSAGPNPAAPVAAPVTSPGKAFTAQRRGTTP